MGLKLNDKEQKIYDILKGGKKTIEELAHKAWPSKGVGPNTKGNSHVRNSLRKIVNAGVAKQIARGTYELTGKKLEDVKDKPKAAKKPAAKKAEKKVAAKKTAKPKTAKPKAAAKPKTAIKTEAKHATTATPLGTSKKKAPKAETKSEAKADESKSGNGHAGHAMPPTTEEINDIDDGAGAGTGTAQI